MNKESFLIALGQIIAKLREERGYSQTQFAQLIGISRVQLYRYEMGQREIGGHLLGLIASVLNVTIPDLIREDAYPNVEEVRMTFTNSENTHSMTKGRVLRITKITGLDFIEREGLHLSIKDAQGLPLFNKFLCLQISQLDKYTTVIEPIGWAYPIGNGLEIKIVDLIEPEKDYEVHINCDIIY
jgi:transcriptional regulator with XRE-family HTH domain